jgi:hypothetical protein
MKCWTLHYQIVRNTVNKFWCINFFYLRLYMLTIFFCYPSHMLHKYNFCGALHIIIVIRRTCYINIFYVFCSTLHMLHGLLFIACYFCRTLHVLHTLLLEYVIHATRVLLQYAIRYTWYTASFLGGNI